MLKIPKKSQKPLFLRWVIFDIFLQSVFCICILCFVFCIFVFSYFCFGVFLAFCLLQIGHWVSLTLGAVNSNSRVASDHQNRHHHHQMSIRTQKRPKMSLLLRRQIFDIFFGNYAMTKTIDRTRRRRPTFLIFVKKLLTVSKRSIFMI